MSMNNADFQARHLDHFFFGQILEGFIFEVALNCMKIVGEGLGPIVNLPAAHVTRTDHSVDFVGRNNLAVPCRYFCGSVGDVEVA